MIYFARGTVSGAIKIGYSSDPARRLEQMQTGSAERLELLGAIPGSISDEKHLHRQLDYFRLRPDGEWFRGAEEMTYVIDKLLGAPIPDLLRSSKAKLWYVRGTATLDGDTNDPEYGAIFRLFCVCHEGRYDELRLPPDLFGMLAAVYPDADLESVSCIIDAASHENLWPKDHEALRHPLTDGSSSIWVADLYRSTPFYPMTAK